MQRHRGSVIAWSNLAGGVVEALSRMIGIDIIEPVTYNAYRKKLWKGNPIVGNLLIRANT